MLSFQGPLAVRLGYDTDLLAAVCEKLARALMQDLRRDVKRRHGLASVTPLHAGVMVAVQRFRSDLGLYVHLHCLVTDGVFEDLGEQLPLDFTGRDSAEPEGPPESAAPRRIGWARLLARVFAVDVTRSGGVRGYVRAGRFRIAR